MTNTERLIYSLECAKKAGVDYLNFYVGKMTGNGPAVVGALKRRGFTVERNHGVRGSYRLSGNALGSAAGFVTDARKIFEACGNDVPLGVMNVCGSAADNAVATINENGGVFVRGKFTDEFICYWILTVQGILSESDCDPEARAWFEAAGVEY